MDVQKMDETDKLNFIIGALKNKPALIDEIVEKAASELDEPDRKTLYTLVVATKGYMAKMEKYHNAKDNAVPGEYLLFAIEHACALNRVIPHWARQAFHDCWHSYRSYDVNTFSDAFHLEKRRNIAQRRKRWMLQYLVWGDVIRLHRESPTKNPISRSTFDKVAKKYGISGGTVRDIYYEVSPKQEIKKVKNQAKTKTSKKQT
ncbi:hypothetical protein METHB2_160040 [Candidatus Methylobacter favarea]|uniref:Uncharacterized protein n=1 Tax=Candidatus Methylobacter favarea TaxID=2707345 RepID=A0A8S0XHR7_9GAMM|nr:hypothetical protein [Candidatus Methylobacter favarea]CAA9889973.1 hypothetical protein METHB2_160040 [Candidatus Methylobacter favarea]